MLGLDPDLVLYMGSVEKYREQCVADVVDLLAAGIDVVATGSSFIDIRAFDPEAGRRMSKKPRASRVPARSSASGCSPASGAKRSRRCCPASRSAATGSRSARAMSYVGYPSTEMMFDVMGYGQPPESDDAVLGDITHAGYAFISTAMIVAKALDLEVAAVEPFREVAVTDTELHVAAGIVPAGTVGAMKLGIRADCGPVEILVEHVTWMGPDVVPDGRARATRSSSMASRRSAATSSSGRRVRTTPRWDVWRRRCTRCTRSQLCARRHPASSTWPTRPNFVGRLR